MFALVRSVNCGTIFISELIWKMMIVAEEPYSWPSSYERFWGKT